VRPLVAQGAGKHVWPIAQLLRRPYDPIFRGFGNVACKRSVVEDDRDRGGRKPALFRHFANGYR